MVIFLLLALISIPAQAQTRSRHYPFVSQEEYDEKVDALNGFIDRYGKRRVNRIFVAKVQNDDGKEHLYGFWKEDNSILLIGHFARYYGNGKDQTDYEWLHRKARVDLRTEVVPTEEDIRGSTYLVDKPWADRIVKACLTKGRKVVIHRSANNKNTPINNALPPVSRARANQRTLSWGSRPRLYAVACFAGWKRNTR